MALAAWLTSAVAVHAQGMTAAAFLSEYSSRWGHAPNVSLEWTHQDMFGILSRTEFFLQNGKYLYRTFVRPKGETDEKLTKMAAFDGKSYYNLSNDHLTISSDLQDPRLLADFETKFLQNPLFYPQQLLLPKRDVVFTLPALEGSALLAEKFLPYAETVSLQNGRGVLSLKRDEKGRTTEFDPTNFRILSSTLHIKGKPASNCAVDDWVDLKEGGVQISIPCRITCVEAVKGAIIEQIMVNKAKIAVLKEVLPDDFFRPPTSAAKVILDKDLGSEIKR